MQFGRKDLKVTLESESNFPVIRKDVLSLDKETNLSFDKTEEWEIPYCSELEELDNQSETSLLETVHGIVISGPFAGPYIVEIVKYTGTFRTKYFYNGHSILYRELYLCGPTISLRRLSNIWQAMKIGYQVDNSTVPMISTDLLTGKDLENPNLSQFDAFFNHAPEYLLRRVSVELWASRQGLEIIS